MDLVNGVGRYCHFGGREQEEQKTGPGVNLD